MSKIAPIITRLMLCILYEHSTGSSTGLLED
uniref:Uncharacterized protein n=1 Tax=Arundo donax TaxID=35708 RepID=A0A0A8YNH3_ARUDO